MLYKKGPDRSEGMVKSHRLRTFFFLSLNVSCALYY